MGKLHRIALSGMKGRKKDTAVLILVIVLSFLFLTVGTILLSSLTETQRRQRMSLYGSWKLADSRRSYYVSDMLRRQPWISCTHDVEVLGTDENCGSVSVWNEDFARMGGLKLIQGRAPEKAGEIVVEKGQLSLFPEEVGLGSTIELNLIYQGLFSPEIPDPEAPKTLTLFGVSVDAAPFYRMLASDLNPEKLEEGIRNFVQNHGQLPPEMSFAEKFPMELPDFVEEMTHDEIHKMLDYLASEPAYFFAAVGDYISVRMHTSILRPSGTVGEVGWRMRSEYTLRTAAGNPDSDRIPMLGALNEQRLTLSRKCKVVGILETTADRWDVTDITVPNAYLSAETRQEMQDCVNQLVQQKRPDWFHADPDTVLTQSSFTFHETGLSMADTYQKLREIPGNVAEQQPMEVFHHSGAPVPDLEMTKEEILREAESAGFDRENVIVTGQREPGLYTLLFEDDRGKQASAYYLVPQLFVRLEDSDFRDFSASLGTLVYPRDGGWETQKVDGTILTETDFAPPGYHSLGALQGSLEDAYAFNSQVIGINRYAYPSDRGLASAMGGTLVAVIVMITVCAVFQIFFTQLRRRGRKLTLLRSIGATTGQLFAILGFEGLYVLLAGLILGDGFGWLIARGILSRLPGTVFYMDGKLVLTGQLWGILAVAAGMVLPSIRAIHAPLVGKMTGKKRRHVRIKAMKRQTFRRICSRDRRANPGRTLGLGALCIFLLTMQLVCVFLGTAAFGNYRESVTEADRPDFVLRMNHAGSNRKVTPMQETLVNTEGLERCDFYRRGKNLFLWYEGMENSPVVKAVKETDSRFLITSKSREGKADPALQTEFFCAEADSDLFFRLEAALDEGSIDRKAYEDGEQVIVLLPMLREKSGGRVPRGETFAQALDSAGRMQFSFDRNLGGLWQKDTTIAPGDTITLGTDNYILREKDPGYQQFVTHPKVGGIVRTFPEKGIWPFTGEPQSHVIVGSRRAMGMLYSYGLTTYPPEQMNSVDMRVKFFMPTEYGEGIWSIYARKGASVEQTVSPLSRFARQEHLTLQNLMDSKQAVYEKAFSSAVLAGTMALAASLVVWIILYNTLNAAQEQGRPRTGILQALGVTKGQFYLAQARQALGCWLVMMGFSHLILLLVVLISGMTGLGGTNLAAALPIALQLGFRGYPWALHGILCLLELPLLLLFHLRAARIPMGYSPIDNIRS